jgi:ATP-dependent RNA helicase RhlE
LNKPVFASLGLCAPIVRAVNERGYTEPTPIQAQAIPAILKGGDLLASAQTGTGKTAGFTLPILQLLTDRPLKHAVSHGPKPVRVLVLVPTRELAAQVMESVQEYGKYLKISFTAVFGGVGINPQIERFKKHIDILVATPGRLLDHINQKTVNLSQVEILVLDEADRMLDMGFIHDIKKILSVLPKNAGSSARQNLLFSATFPDEIKKLADNLLNKPSLIEIERHKTTAELVNQKIMFVHQGAKRHLLAHLIKENNWFQVLVFMRTKHGANRLAQQLDKQGISALAIHGNKSQNARTRALAEFKNEKLQVLVATDIAARGLDIEQLPHVVNFELPNIPEDYVHRIGRTGRAGASGEALSLVSTDEMEYLKDIEKLIKRSIPREPVPGFVIPTDESAHSVPHVRHDHHHKKANEPRSKRTKTDMGVRHAEPRSLYAEKQMQSQKHSHSKNPALPREKSNIALSHQHQHSTTKHLTAKPAQGGRSNQHHGQRAALLSSAAGGFNSGAKQPSKKSNWRPAKSRHK